MIKASIIGVCILTLVIAFSLRQSDFRPIDFARFRIVEANVVNSNGSRAAIFSKPEHLLTLKQYSLKLKKMNTSYSRLNSGGYFMKVYFEDHDHVDVFFYDNEESGKIITIDNVGYYNNDFWNYLDSVFLMPAVNGNQIQQAK